jgi:hypothetical protein
LNATAGATLSSRHLALFRFAFGTSRPSVAIHGLHTVEIGEGAIRATGQLVKMKTSARRSLLA